MYTTSGDISEIAKYWKGLDTCSYEYYLTKYSLGTLMYFAICNLQLCFGTSIDNLQNIT